MEPLPALWAPFPWAQGKGRGWGLAAYLKLESNTLGFLQNQRWLKARLQIALGKNEDFYSV
jgi:hypothetical protein